MNYYWLISNCSSLFFFRFSLLFAFILSLSLLYLSLIVVLLRLCFLLYALNSSHNISPYLCSVLSFFLYFIFFVLMTLFVFSLYFSVFSI